MAIEIVSFLIVFISSIVSEAVTFISLKLSIKLCIYVFWTSQVFLQTNNCVLRCYPKFYHVVWIFFLYKWKKKVLETVHT